MQTRHVRRWVKGPIGIVLDGAFQFFILWLALHLYRYGRHLIDGRPGLAHENAEQLWNVERMLGMPNEAVLQSAALNWDGWVRVANIYYVNVHFPMTLAFLAWIWWWHHDAWNRVRTAVLATMVLALVLHAVYPLAPPRFMPEAGLLDLMQIYGPSLYSEPPGEGTGNQFAAMPSLHVGWSVLVAWGAVRYGHGQLRWMMVAHPVLTTAIVVLTGNHYWLDGVVGTAVVVAALALTAGLERRPAPARLEPQVAVR